MDHRPRTSLGGWRPTGPAVFLSLVLVAVAASQEAQKSGAEAETSVAGSAEVQGEQPPVVDHEQPPTVDHEQPPTVDHEQPQTPAQPSPEDIIRAFQQDRPAATPIRPMGTGSSKELQDRSAALLREGEYLGNRTGRLSRDGNWWTIVFESDSAEAPRPPMRLLPNQLLERMIRESEAAASSISYLISGEVTMFESDNYLLLRKVMRRQNISALSK